MLVPFGQRRSCGMGKWALATPGRQTLELEIRMTAVATTFQTDRYRQTPLRAHVVRQMGWGDQQSWQHSLQDVLALWELRERIGRGYDQQLRSALTLERFFYEPIAADLDTACLPVEVQHVPHQPEHTYRDLTTLIQQLDEQADTRSVLLVARSGAGKTVAARKAFCDCVVADPTLGQPLLAGYLPCWINVDGTGTRDATGSRCPRLIEHLILRACGVEKQLDADALARWLDQPDLKLLLFFDLNAWAEQARDDVAGDLVRFLDEYRNIGHRAVVAYRSAAVDDGPRRTLVNSGQFQEFNLAPVNTRQAEQYLENIRLFENFVNLSVSPDTPLPQLHAQVAEDKQQLLRLVRRHVGQSEVQESVISTPLLMHFASLLQPGELAGVQTLSDLYDKVVQRHLKREQQRLDVTWTDGDNDGAGISRKDLSKRPQRIRDAMARLAVLIMQQPPGRVSVSRESFCEMLETEPPVYSEAAVELLLEFSLLQQDSANDDDLRLLHDSLIYYFAAATLKPQQHNDSLLGWAKQVVVQLRSWPNGRREVAEFLGGLLDADAFGELLVELLAGPPDETTVDHVTALICGADGGPNGRVAVATRLQQECMRRSGWEGQREPLGFLSEIHETLISEVDEMCTEVAGTLVGRLRQTDRTWLRCMHPRHRASYQEMSEHDSLVFCVDVWVNPADSTDVRVVSGSYDKTVRLWNPSTGLVEIIITCDEAGEGMISGGVGIGCVSALPDGRIVSGSADGTVRLWNPATGIVETIITHDNWVECLAVLPDGRVVSGSNDRTVRHWNPATGLVDTIITHNDRVTTLAALPDGRVVSGSWDNTVRLWNPGTGLVETIITHDEPVGCLAALPDGRIVSGSLDNTVRLWNPATGLVETIITHDEPVACLTALPDGHIVSGSNDRTVRRWNPATGLVETIVTHDEPVECLTALPDGRVVSGSLDNTVRIWNPITNSVNDIITHDDGVECLAVLPDGRVVSGSYDKTVRLWNPGTGLVETIITHDEPVECLTALPDGRVVSGSADETVRLWNPATGLVETIITHNGWVTTLAALPDGRVVSGSWDKTVRLWNPITNSVKHIITHDNWVTCLSVLHDVSVVSGCADGTVRRWVPSTKNVEELVTHDDWVECLTVLDNDRIVSGGADKTVRLSEPVRNALGKNFFTRSKVKCLTRSTDSSQVYAGLENGEVLFLQVESGKAD